jgi:adenylate cyclase
MPHTFRLEIGEAGHAAHAVEVTGPVELGRQRSGEPEPYALLPAGPGHPARLVVARQPEGDVSRQHALLEPAAAGAVRLRNLTRVPIRLELGEPVAPESTAELTPPFTLLLGPRTVRVEMGESVDDHGLRSLDGATIGPNSSRAPAIVPALATFGGQVVNSLLAWLQQTLGVLQSTIGSVHFVERAAEAMVSIVKLTSGHAILFEGDGWRTLAAYPPGAAPEGWQPSRHVLDRVRRDHKTFWQDPGPAAAAGEAHSLVAVQTVVAAPLLSPEGEVIGALYGERRRVPGEPPRPVGKLEALLVELLACGVATGLARQEQEKAALAAAVRFEQFFTPELARHLAREPRLLEGREAEVTLLFSDIRRFSAASEKLGPAGTVKWVGDVMDELSRCVLAEGGVLVDYIGDELVAMWGAPEAQPDHPARAARAALAMLAALPAVDGRWRATLGGPTDLGVGLNTGVAQVGNTGSRHKFKYGPLGNAANIASRVQGLTKYLRCRLLVTGATRERLGEGFIARRVCRARLVNIQEAADVFEVEAAADEARARFFRDSEAALEALEARDFSQAAGAAGALLNAHPHDGPLRLTLARAAEMLVNEDAPFDPVWTPPGK